MKKLIFKVLTVACLAGTIQVHAQEIKDNTTNYRRSSLTMVLIEDDLGKSKDLIIKSYEDNPFPDKYNKHDIKDKKFDPSSMKLTIEDYKSAGFYNDTLRTTKDFLMAKKKPNNAIRYLTDDKSAAVLEPTKKELLQIYLDKYISEKDLAKQVAATWFNRKDDGSMNWELIKERGMYSAAEFKKDQASTVADETSFLLDFELIGNTYTIFNKMEFYENEPVAAAIRDVAKIKATEELAGKPDIFLQKALEGIDKVYEKTKEGYTVKCTSFLYQFNWNEEIAKKVDGIFNLDDQGRKIAWDTTSIFKMNFVGQITSASIVTFKLGETRTEEQIIDLQIRRTMDNALAKLQKKYVQFRPVSPVISIEPLTARIGMKEDLEPGQKFEILEMSYDKNKQPTWKSVGKVSVDKKVPVWDNRQGAEPNLDSDGNPLPEATVFKGGSKAQPGLSFIRLLK